MKINLQQKKEITRSGFTLVELMVALAIIILMLSILSQAFVIATNTLQGLKEVAELQERMRPALSLLQRDLSAYHFDGTKKLSDPNFWDNGPPKEGYFMLWQEYPFEISDPTDPSNATITPVTNGNLLSHLGNEGNTDNSNYRLSAGRANHMLAFTVKLPGKNPEELFATKYPYYPISGIEKTNIVNLFNYFEDNSPSAPRKNSGIGNHLFYNTGFTPQAFRDYNTKRFEDNPNFVHSQWAEVAYFLGPNLKAQTVGYNYPISTNLPYTDGKDPQGNPIRKMPLYTLYRRQKMVLPEIGQLADRNEAMVSPPPYEASLPPLSIGIQNSEYITMQDVLGEYSFWPNFVNFKEIQSAPGNIRQLVFNSPKDLTIPWKRMGNRYTDLLGSPVVTNMNPHISMPPSVAGPPVNGILGPLFTENTLSNEFTDVLATNVISFDIRLLTDDRLDYEDLYTILSQPAYAGLKYPPVSSPYLINPHNGIYNYANMGTLLGYSNFIAIDNPLRRVFDTWTTSLKETVSVRNLSIPKSDYDQGEFNSVPGKWQPNNVPSLGLIPVWNQLKKTGLQVKAVQISIRIWDSRSNSARLFVLVQKV